MSQPLIEFLARTEAFIKRGEELCTQQAVRINAWRSWGQDTATAEATLADFETILTEMRLHQAQLQDEAAGRADFDGGA